MAGWVEFKDGGVTQAAFGDLRKLREEAKYTTYQEMQERRNQEHEADREHIAECQRLARLESQPAPTSLSTIRDAITLIEQMTTQVQMGVDVLTERLDVALRPVAPEPCPKMPEQPSEPKPFKSHLENRLRAAGRAIEVLNTRLLELCDRIDL